MKDLLSMDVHELRCALTDVQYERDVLRRLFDAVARWAKHDESDPLPALRHDAELLEEYEACRNATPLSAAKGER